MPKVCSKCEKSKTAGKSSFPPDGRASDGLGAECWDCRNTARELAGVLETVDLDGVEVLAAGGPYFGTGSPPEGDEFTVEDLEEIAAANVALEEELKPYLKIGHNKEQRLLRESGLAEDEKPSAGWWENFRVDGEKLLADLKRVPKKLAQLIEIGAFRTRSVELSKIVGQDGDNKGVTFPRVVSACSLLGARAPAVHTLDDIIALYAGALGRTEHATAAELIALDVSGPTLVYAASAELEAEVVQFVDTYAEGDVVWNPGDGCNWLMEKVRAAVNPGPESWRYWIMDVSRDASRAIVQSNEGTWVVPFELEGDGVKLSPSSDWTLAEQAWVESAAEYARLLSENRKRADTSTRMAEFKLTKDYSAEQIESLATGFGIAESDPEKRQEAVEAKLAEFSSEPAPDPAPDDEPDEPAAPAPAPGGDAPTSGEAAAGQPQPTAGTALAQAEMETLRANADLGRRVYEERRLEKRDNSIRTAMEEGRIDPAKEKFWQQAFDEDAERAEVLLAEMPVNPELLAVYGSDAPTGGDGDRVYSEWARISGVKETEGVAA